MKQEYDNDSGIAYAFFMVIALLIIGSIMWMAMSSSFNTFLGPINDRITSGQMSTQTAGPIRFGISLLEAVPIFLLIGVFIYVVLAGVNKRNEGG
jgi:hypothetical protein